MAEPTVSPLPIVSPLLLVSVSGLAAELAPARLLADALDARGVPLTHLVRPADASTELIDWVRARCADGDALAVHGYDHAARPLGHRRTGRGEFAGLPRHEAGLRLTAARRAFTAFGLRTDVFVPPRWCASDGTAQALTDQGFRVLADDAGVRDLVRGTVVAGRVLRFRAASEHRLFGAEVAWALRRGGLVRVDLRGEDLHRPGRAGAVLAAVDAALARGAVPATYRWPAEAEARLRA